MNEIENEYELGYGITTDKPEKITEKIEYILSIPNYKDEWSRKRQKIFEDKIDVAQFYKSIIVKYLKN